MKILFVLNGSTGNRGCEAILLSTYDILKAAFPNAKFINSSFKDERVSHVPYLDLPDLKHACHPEIRSIPGIRWQISKRIQGHRFNFERFLPWANAVLSLGGDNYSLDYGSVRTYFEANERILAAGKKLVIWGASIGPFDKDPSLERYAAEHLKRVHKIVVRETRTLRYLDGLGIKQNVMLMPDPAFSLSRTQAEVTPQIEHLLSQGAIGLNLSPLLARYRPSPERWLSEAADWLDALLAKTQSPVLLIPHVIQPGNDDAAFLSALKSTKKYPPERLQLLSAHDLSSRQIKDVIARLRCFIGARTHATIAALSENVPTLSIGYSVKARGINEDIFGNDHWVVDHLTLDPENLAEKVNELLLAGDEIRAHLTHHNQSYRMIPESVRALLV
ncbi:polysaccharide pyruvyl transferase family protein [Lamprobacter modestohalophilus]|uniref:polysaccharide pyruvyl transferase family protein n=1 Tax=Lamprobacter modestohalophilus TaxID=1064514 RepID=UPI002ADEB797|nr:polysaccharide pyruvyl transferase family protein [Lamprobacter modestohalophilus]MEA1049007.1 polysaccharide pyruvyl transferase family protein [Lamprobacter modestohalophilus]